MELIHCKINPSHSQSANNSKSGKRNLVKSQSHTKISTTMKKYIKYHYFQDFQIVRAKVTRIQLQLAHCIAAVKILCIRNHDYINYCLKTLFGHPEKKERKKDDHFKDKFICNVPFFISLYVIHLYIFICIQRQLTYNLNFISKPSLLRIAKIPWKKKE